jgi:hypothetical protein
VRAMTRAFGVHVLIGTEKSEEESEMQREKARFTLPTMRLVSLERHSLGHVEEKSTASRRM